MSDSSNLQEIIASFESEKFEEQQAAASRLREMGKRGLSLEDGLTALRAAAREYPPRRFSVLDSSEDLIRAATAHPRPEYIPVIVELYPTYGERAKVEVMCALARMEEREAAEAWMSIIRSYAREGGVPLLRVWTLQPNPHHADVFFPELLGYADIQALSYDIYSFCLTYLQHGLLATEQLVSYAGQVLDDYHACENALRPSQQAEGVAWMWDEEYHQWREKGALLLNLMGFFPTPGVKQSLREALTYTDPKPRGFAVVSLLRLGEQVDAAHTSSVAQSAEMRNCFYDELQRLDHLALFPSEYRTQEAFAESDMVNWLTYPAELGRVPDAIELIKMVTIDTETDDGLLDYFVFRFRVDEPHWAAKEGWMAGVSGPFLRKDAPSTVSYGHTFSSFEPWDSMTPEERVGDAEDVVDSWQRYHRRR